MAAVTGVDRGSELRAALERCRSAIVGVALMSAVLNILLLGGSMYMMLVYDMVLPSRSVPTLIGLLVMVAVVYVFQALIEMIRGRMLVGIAAALDGRMRGRIHDIVQRLSLRRAVPGDGLQPIHDLDQIRNFLAGNGPGALIDLPWMFFFIAILFLFHPWLGVTALAGGLVLVALTFATDRVSRAPMRYNTAISSARSALANAARRNADVIHALGMRRRVAAGWEDVSRHQLGSQEKLNQATGTLGSASKIFRQFLQSSVLTVGALLVIDGKASGGVIFAGSFLTARALAPVELAIANWRGFVAARQGWARLTQLLQSMPPEAAVTPLPAPGASVEIEHLTLVPPGAEQASVVDVTFRMEAGEAVGVIGPSASGKSSLVRGIVGVWTPARGTVRIDGAALDQWDSDALGAHIGYLPQSVSLMEGTVAQNIARFDPEAAPEAIIAAARSAGVHDLILHLKDGYETQVGPAGQTLSAGQQQRVALARALFGAPFLVVLDEPNSNLDAEGEAALAEAIRGVRARKGIVILVAHRPAALAVVDKVLVMREGRLRAFGPRDEVLKQVLGQQGKIRTAAPPMQDA
ncbi:type I secretion system permease/ATPase [Sphingomonas profundi]|uniref:type I secretion system permease/ATPase n=1 Tax=Alterirhizorhabdus profundi TaxID=2681549 RepID=UPI0018CFFAB3|nr:type I secretion system permease/ATPase [Sphingomonas profundi]